MEPRKNLGIGAILSILLLVAPCRSSLLDIFSSSDAETGVSQNLCEKNSWDCNSCPTDLDMGRIKGLDCSSRKIKDLGKSITVSEVIKRVDFSDNAIGNLTFATFGIMKMVYVLDLGHNKVEQIQDYTFSSGRFINLRVLQLRQNLLSEVTNYTFFGLDNLEYLDMGKNRIKTLAAGAFEPLKKLSRLVLRDNPLGNFINRYAFPNGLLFGGNRLKNLHLDGTGLSVLPNEAVAGTSLVYLDISRNSFKEVPRSLKSVGATLLELDISDNPIAVLDYRSFAELWQLKIFRGNNMRRLRVVKENTFKNMTQLISFSLSGNRELRVIHKDAFGPKFEANRMTRFILSNNGLRTLEEKLVNWKSIDVVDLQGNHWRCNCELKWMNNLKLPKNLLGNLKCKHPSRHDGKIITMMRPQDFTCSMFWNKQNKSTTGAEIFLAIVLLFTVSLIAARYCRPPISGCPSIGSFCSRMANSMKRRVPGAAPIAGYSKVGPTPSQVDYVELEWDDKDLAPGAGGRKSRPSNV